MKTSKIAATQTCPVTNDDLIGFNDYPEDFRSWFTTTPMYQIHLDKKILGTLLLTFMKSSFDGWSAAIDKMKKRNTLESATGFVVAMDEVQGEGWSNGTDEIAKAMVSYSSSLMS